MGCGESKEEHRRSDDEDNDDEDNFDLDATSSSSRAANCHKVIVIGDSSVGKSSLVTSVLNRPFSSEHRSTIGTAYSSVDISPREGEPAIELQLWDTAGEERFKSMTQFFYRKTQVAVLVFDVHNAASLRSLRVWHEDIVRVSPAVKFIVCGNKLDDGEEDGVVGVREEAAHLASELGDAPLMWASAKTGRGVRQLFQRAALLTL